MCGRSDSALLSVLEAHHINTSSEIERVGLLREIKDQCEIKLQTSNLLCVALRDGGNIIFSSSELICDLPSAQNYHQRSEYGKLR